MKEIKTLMKASFKNKLFYLLRMDRSFEPQRSRKDDTHEPPSTSYEHFSYQKEIQRAMLEAERSKAQGIMEWQKRRYL